MAEHEEVQGRVTPALSSTSVSDNEMDEDWNFVQLPSRMMNVNGGADTPMTNSSCEYVRVAQDGVVYHRSDDASDTSSDNESPANTTQIENVTTESSPKNDLDLTSGESDPPAATPLVEPVGATYADPDVVDCGTRQKTSVAASSSSSLDESKDEELRHLMQKLQAKVRSGSPCNSVSTDSDYVQLASGPEREELMDVSTGSSAASRFNIIIQREQSPHVHSEDEEGSDLIVLDEEQPVFEDEMLRQRRLRQPGDPGFDRDDRAESDIIAAGNVMEPRDDAADENDVIRAQPVRHYIHSPNSGLNTVLTAVALAAIGFAMGIAIGHSFGSSREAKLQQEIQEGQKLRLRSVQDDLLMCLRKQEDIDQTINKLNEIENILVDAEHWRNEYEELLNLKLTNEEKWRQERNELRSNLTDLQRSYDKLVSSKSCAHDSEYLSRQENTLKSVHEKLGESLTEKDRQIVSMQTEISDYKINLRTADEMASAYRKSNEDKSLLILSLKENLLELEREAFDLRVTSESAASSTSATESASTPVQKQEHKAVTAPTPEAKEESQAAAANLASVKENTAVVVQLERDLVSCEIKVTALQTEMAKAVAPQQLSVDTQHLPPRNSIVDEKQVEHDYSVPETTAQDLNKCYKETEALSVRNGILQSQIDEYEKEHFRQKNDTSEQTTNMPCINLNVCDQLRVNMTSTQLLRLYNASRDKYRSIEEFVLSEWKNLSAEFLGDVNATTLNAFDPKLWQQYLNETRASLSGVLESFNSTWEEIKNLTHTVIEPAAAEAGKPGFHRKVQKKLSKVAKTIHKGFNHVKEGLVEKLGGIVSDFMQSEEQSQENKQTGRNSKVNPKKKSKKKRGQGEQSQIPTEQTGSSRKPDTDLKFDKPKPSKSMKKFEQRLGKLRKDLYSMDLWRARKMKRYEQEDLYDRFDDFGEDYSYMFSNPDLSDVKTWVDCQSLWWRQQAFHTDTDTDTDDEGIISQCRDQLMEWQLSSTQYPQQHIQIQSDTTHHSPHWDEDSDDDSTDGSWQYERAEWRKYHREEPDDWYWRRAHNNDHLQHNLRHPTDIPFPKDEL